MEELVDEGVAKNIGVSYVSRITALFLQSSWSFFSNCAGSILLDILRYARIAPQVNQVELHPYLTQEGLINFCKTHHIALTGYSSLGPQSYVELGFKGTSGLLEHDVVNSIAKTLGKSERHTLACSMLRLLTSLVLAPAQILLRWAVQQGIAIIPKSNNHDRLLSNKDVLDWSLTDDHFKALSSLNINLRVRSLCFFVSDALSIMILSLVQLNNPAEIDPRLAIFA